MVKLAGREVTIPAVRVVVSSTPCSCFGFATKDKDDSFDEIFLYFLKKFWKSGVG